MFGKNQQLGQVQDEGKILWVQEIFHTIQGEGPHAGKPAVFVRLAGCNLACWFCDTEFESSTWRPTFSEVADRVAEITNAFPTNLVVLSGGEPFRQNLNLLISLLNARGLIVQVETDGLLYWPWIPVHFAPRGRHSLKVNTIVCSPKTRNVHPKLAPYIHYLKYIVSHENDSTAFSLEDGLPTLSTQVQGAADILVRPKDLTGQPFPNEDVFLQPCDEKDEVKNSANMRQAAGLCMDFGYRLSLQLHKVVGLP